MKSLISVLVTFFALNVHAQNYPAKDVMIKTLKVGERAYLALVSRQQPEMVLELFLRPADNYPLYFDAQCNWLDGSLILAAASLNREIFAKNDQVINIDFSACAPGGNKKLFNRKVST